MIAGMHSTKYRQMSWAGSVATKANTTADTPPDAPSELYP